MLVIGLVGSSPEMREIIAGQLLNISPNKFIYWQAPPSISESRRIKTIHGIVKEFKTRFRNDQGAVIAHVLTANEAEAIRKAGGFIWHVYGSISGDIRADDKDLFVRPRESNPYKNYLEVIEALSVSILNSRNIEHKNVKRLNLKGKSHA